MSYTVRMKRGDLADMVRVDETLDRARQRMNSLCDLHGIPPNKRRKPLVEFSYTSEDLQHAQFVIDASEWYTK